jgi:hypothetical protein
MAFRCGLRSSPGAIFYLPATTLAQTVPNASALRAEVHKIMTQTHAMSGNTATTRANHEFLPHGIPSGLYFGETTRGGNLLYGAAYENRTHA